MDRRTLGEYRIEGIVGAGRMGVAESTGRPNFVVPALFAAVLVGLEDDSHAPATDHPGDPVGTY